MMRNYSIYLLKEDVAYEYFGKEDLIYHLFLEYKQAKNMDKLKLLKKQIHYITMPISVLEIQRFLQKNLPVQMLSHDKIPQFEYQPIVRGWKSHARLKIYKRYLLLLSEGNFEAETHIFEVLRKYKANFLAMDFEHHKYGWLNPIKQKLFFH